LQVAVAEAQIDPALAALAVTELAQELLAAERVLKTL
jgi:hypothetical protein